MSNTLIYENHLNCLDIFEKVIKSIGTGTGESPNQLPQEEVLEEFDRYKLWAGNTGAANTGAANWTISLDFRLQEAEFLKNQVIRLLQLLSWSLARVLSLVDGTGIPFEDKPSFVADTDDVPDGSSGESESDSPWEISDDGSIQSDEADASQQLREMTSHPPNSEMAQLIDSIKRVIVSLYKLPVRRAPPIDRVRGFASGDMSLYQHFDMLYVRDKFPTADSRLVKRLGKLISRRRRLLEYRITHTKRLQPPPPKAYSAISSSPAAQEQLTQEAPSASGGKLTTQRTLLTANSPSTGEESARTKTSILRADQTALNSDALYEPSVGESAQSAVSQYTGDAQLWIPPRPKGENGQPLTHFECPCCGILKYVPLEPKWAWASHVLRDLQPYVCTFEGCEMFDHMFESKTEWFTHELEVHRVEWSCNTCTKTQIPDVQHSYLAFSDQAEFIKHMAEAHGLDQTTVSRTAQAFSRPTPVIDGECCLCGRHAHKLKSHLGRHMEQLALFALPRPPPGPMSGSRNVVAEHGSGGIPSYQQLPSEFDLERSECLDETREPTQNDPSTQSAVPHDKTSISEPMAASSQSTIVSFLSKFKFWSSNDAPNGDAELRTLRKEVQRSITYNGIDHRAFVPARQIDALVTIDRVAAVLSRNPSDDLVVFVSQNARKVFLALVLGGGCSANDLESIMRSCRVYKMTDDELPVQAMPCMGRGEDKARDCSPSHAPWLNVFHDSRWEDIMFRFRDDQYTVNSPVFVGQKFRYDLPAECVLPFTARGTSERDGHFSIVADFTLHQDHFEYAKAQEGYNVRPRQGAGGEPLRVSLKKMKHLDNEPGYNVATAWEHEVSALDEIRRLRHRHLMRPLAAINHGLAYYIMFEWADGGSLRDVWQSEGDDAQLTPTYVMWVVEELVGIAGALAALHDTNVSTKTALITRASRLLAAAASGPSGIANRQLEATRPETLPVSTIRLQQDRSNDESHRGSNLYRSDANSEDTDMEEFEVRWRHGDLKPDNILWFRDPSARHRLGTLKIAELGVAKPHFDRALHRYTPSRYGAPEAARANPELSRSRRYDIWSMGCIILEFVIVLLYGSDGLADFYSEMPSRASTDTLYFTLDTNNDTAHVSRIAKHWIHGMLQDPECSRPEGSAISDLITLVRDRLLVVGIPEQHMTSDEMRECRADARELHQKLERIWMVAFDRGDNYLLAGATRDQSTPKWFREQKPPRQEGRGD